ncbi:MAG: 2OG-Fe(II) oxygenase [Pseudomonadota bacterium]|nr:2OG-Fe(II) oxygenase [Pseudomonadota bacterium]
MTVLEQARKLEAEGRQQAAAALIANAASAGEPNALFQLACWRLFGVNGSRDLDAAHELLGRAGRAGHVEALRLQAILVGNGTGCAARPEKALEMLKRIRTRDAYAALQLGLIKKMRPEKEAARLSVGILSGRPSIRAVRGLFTPEECRYVMALAEPHLQPSTVIDPATGTLVPHPVRTSSGMSFGPTQEDLVIHRINRRLAAVTSTQVGWGEPLHVLQYAPGQQYRPHMDAVPGLANQRHWTVLVYLNEGYGGGATRFELCGVEFTGQTGDALVFRNVDEAGRADPLTRHSGLPVTGGVKWLATRWIRGAPYHPWTAPDAPR